jgi:hypothetical protein
MKNISYVLAALATIAIAAPAIAQDKPAKEGMSESPTMHEGSRPRREGRRRGRTTMHVHHHYHHHMHTMKKEGM